MDYIRTEADGQLVLTQSTEYLFLPSCLYGFHNTEAGFSPKAVSRRFGHSSEILTVDYYGDNRKIAAIKLDRLEDYIEMVRPDEDKKEDCTDVKIDTDRHFK